LSKLIDLEKARPDVFDDDALREKIDALFKSHVGDPPDAQADLDAIYKEGAARYLRRTPPGYLDASKGSSDDEFDFGGLTYKRQFGDLIIWSQIIETASQKQMKNVVFVTDDEKEDWWWIEESQGKKRLGPRPELVDEIRRRSKVDSFHMYNSEQLVRWSGQYLQVAVQGDSAEQIREAKDAVSLRLHAPRLRQYEGAVLRWVKTRHPGASFPTLFNPFPDIIVETPDGRRLGYEVLAMQRSRPLILGRIRDVMLRAYYEMNQRNYNEFWLVVLDVDPSDSDRIFDSIRHREGASLIARIGLIIGEVVGSEDEELAEFLPLKVVTPLAQ
jgi:hypothetical protein